MREIDYPLSAPAAGPRLRWSAVFAGSAITLAILAGCNILGIGLGELPAVANSSLGNAAPPGAVSAGWTLCSGIVAYFLGGCVAGRLADGARRSDGAICGLVSWAASCLMEIYAPAVILGGTLSLAATGLVVFLGLVLQAAAAAAGGLAGARSSAPAHGAPLRRTHRELNGARHEASLR